MRKSYTTIVLLLILTLFTSTSFSANEFEISSTNDDDTTTAEYSSSEDYYSSDDNINLYDGNGQVCANTSYVFSNVNPEKTYYEYYLLDDENYILDIKINNGSEITYTFTEPGTFQLRKIELDGNSIPIENTEITENITVEDCGYSNEDSIENSANTYSDTKLYGTLTVEAGKLSYIFPEISETDKYEIIYNLPEKDINEQIDYKSVIKKEKKLELDVSDISLIQVVQVFENESGEKTQESFEISLNNEKDTYMIRRVNDFDVDIIKEMSAFDFRLVIILVVQIIILIFIGLKIQSLRKKRMRKKRRSNRRKG